MKATSFLLLCSAAISIGAPVYQLHEWGSVVHSNRFCPAIKERINALDRQAAK